MKKLPIYEMLIDENVDSDMEVDFIALVDKPAIKKDFVKFSEEFIEPVKGERQTEFMPRCISYVVNEGKSNEQAVAICSSMWEQHFAEGMPHYTKEGILYTGPTHKDASGRLMTGETHTEESVYLYHKGEFKQIDCANCNHNWQVEEGGESPYKCNMCGYDNKPSLSFAIDDEDKRIISGPLMIANQKIYRNDPELGEYEVYFSPETIKKIAIKLAKKGFHNNVNLMHSAELKVPGVTLFEIFQSDKSRGIMPMKGFEDLADGSLFGSMYVENDVAWQYVKDGLIKGFSVEGNFGMKKKDKYDEMFEKIVEILNETKD